MANLTQVRQIFPTVSNIYAEAAASTGAGTATVIDTSGIKNFKLQAVVGKVYVTTISTASTVANSWLLDSTFGDFVEWASHNGYIGLSSTATTATYQLVTYLY